MERLAENSHSTFNPEAVYQVIPQGMWVVGLVDVISTNRTGAIYLPAGTTVYYDSTLVSP